MSPNSSAAPACPAPPAQTTANGGGVDGPSCSSSGAIGSGGANTVANRRTCTCGKRQRASRSRQPGASRNSAPTSQCASSRAIRRHRRPRSRALGRELTSTVRAPAARAAASVATRALPSNTTTAGRSRSIVATTSAGTRVGDAER
jgi:hypothetical protein